MKYSLRRTLQAGFTLVELMVAGAVFSLVGGIAYYLMNVGTVLYTKNYSINASGGALRTGLDRINAEVSQATDMPELITLGGGGAFTQQKVASDDPADLGPAAGILFDKYLGGPYVMDATSGVSPTATGFTMRSAMNSLVVAPVPSADDVVLIDGSKVRSRVASVLVTTSGGYRNLGIALRSGSTTGVSWMATEIKTAVLVRKTAFIVVGNELRFYPLMEGVTNYATAPYTVLTRDVGTTAGEDKPFSIVIKNGRPFLKLSFRVQNRDANNSLAKKESKEFNTSMRIDTLIRPRNAH